MSTDDTAAGAVPAAPEPTLSRINELAKVYAISYASPHHFTISAAGVSYIIRDLAAAPKAAPAEPAGDAPAEPVAPQLGMTNDELMAAWRQKLTTAEPKGNDLSAFAVGIEWGWERARDTERSDWARVHHVLAKHQVHPGRTDDHLADVIDRALSAASPTVAQPLTADRALDLAEPLRRLLHTPADWGLVRAYAATIQNEAAAAWGVKLGVKLGGGAV